MHLPKRVAAVRHGESAYNKMAAVKQAHPLYRQFDAAFQARSENPERAVELANELLDAQVLSFGASDLSDNGNRQLYETGAGLSGNRELPDLVIA
ncbi:hypothetical protein EKI60_00345 [Candidatus Saccharibacteria bacterium]|nr:MAG: hypothetical protein EKI60_00345 [Candidatus Saccharibacteria bacterium]